MAYRKTSGELRKRPVRKEKTVNKPKMDRNKKHLIIGNILLSILLIISTVSFSVTALFEKNIFKRSGEDTKESKQYEVIKKSESEKVAYFLVCGVDLGKNLTDVIMVVCYDLENNKANILQIPRDTYVGSTVTGKINAVYGSPREGESKIKALIRSINDNFGLPIDHYVTITIQGTEDVIDALGGIDIKLKRGFSLVDDSRSPEQKRRFEAGKTHLDGQWATALIRHRATLAGDIGRLENQRTVYAALMKKIIKSSLSDITSVATKCFGDISTDLTLGQILGYAEKAHELTMKDIRIMTIPGYCDYVGSQSCYIVRKQDAVNMINESFMVYSNKTLTADDISIYGGTQNDHSWDDKTKTGTLDDFDNDIEHTDATVSAQQ